MKPDYQSLTKKELKAYILEYRDDIEAIRLLFQVPSGIDIKRYLIVGQVWNGD